MKVFLLKITRIVLILLGIYFAIGLLASVVFIIIEAITNQMSKEIIKDMPNFKSWIIYFAMIIFAVTSAGLSFVSFLGAKSIKKHML